VSYLQSSSTQAIDVLSCSKGPIHSSLLFERLRIGLTIRDMVVNIKIPGNAGLFGIYAISVVSGIF